MLITVKIETKDMKGTHWHKVAPPNFGAGPITQSVL